MFGFIHNRFKKATKSRQEKQARRRFIPGVETLERRDAPAFLSFVSPAGIYAQAAANGPIAGQARSLLSSNSGDVVSRTSGGSKAFASLANYPGRSDYKFLEVTTSARGQASSQPTQARAW